MSETNVTTEDVKARLTSAIERLPPMYPLEAHPAAEIAELVESLVWMVVSDIMDAASDRIEAGKATAHSEKGEG